MPRPKVTGLSYDCFIGTDLELVLFGCVVPARVTLDTLDARDPPVVSA